jgi:hypothetical protein
VALAAAARLSLSSQQMGEPFMRAGLCVVAVLLGCTSVGHAQDSRDSSDRINPRWKKIEIPTIDPNLGFSARLSADQSNYWQTPDPSSVNQAKRSWNQDDRTFGLTISRSFAPY